jgi:hypothetical protein
VLKKAGIVVATATAGLLAVSPLAFAGDKGDDDGHRHHGGEADMIAGDTSEGLINPDNLCDNKVPVDVLGIQVPSDNVEVLADLSGALGPGLLGHGQADDKDGKDGKAVQDDYSCHEVAGEVPSIGV